MIPSWILEQRLNEENSGCKELNDWGKVLACEGDFSQIWKSLRQGFEYLASIGNESRLEQDQKLGSNKTFLSWLRCENIKM